MAGVVSQDSPGRAAADLQQAVQAINDPQPAVIAIVGAILVVAAVWNAFNIYWLMVLDPFLAHRNRPQDDEADDSATPERDTSPHGRWATRLDPLRALAPPPAPQRRHAPDKAPNRD